MVIASWLEETLEKRRQRQIKAAENAGVVRGRAEAAAEVQQKWEEWNQRREDAAAAGEEFNEPPPGVAWHQKLKKRSNNKGASRSHFRRTGWPYRR